MVELGLKNFVAEQESSITSGDRLVKHNPLANDADAGVWNFKTLMIPRPKQRPIVYYEITPTVGQEEPDNLRSEWVESKDQVTTDLVDSEEKQAQELIYRFRTSRNISVHESLAKKLLALHNYAKEEDSTSSGITIGSLRHFFNFFHLHSKLKCPTISLTPDNNVYARWKGEKDCLFSIHFLSNGNASFVIFKPNDKHPELKIRLSGIATTDILMETVESYGVNDWISNEK
jgi:hypothetical protein